VSLINENDNQVYKFSWAMLVAVLSVSGLLMYALWGRNGKSGRLVSGMAAASARLREVTPRGDRAAALLEEHAPLLKRFSVYLDRAGFPLYTGTDAVYFPLGEEKFDALFRDLEHAEKFIFLEYFIVSEGRIWDKMYDILRRKAAAGVEVRFMFDDAGSIATATKRFTSRLSADAIQYLAFHPMYRYMNRLYFNYRNHQKIAVIDGNIGYTGGANIADEYANLYAKHGHWKDAAVRLTGDAVWGLTRIFLTMWEFSGGFVTKDYSAYYPEGLPGDGVAGRGFFQPFADGPANACGNLAETMYTRMIANAGKYVYMTSPYLVLDESLVKTMTTAARSGVDVRIVTPKIFDHWYTEFATQSYYECLLREGVRIFEYTPGFVHSKTIVSDDAHAIVGSINLDYRSFYLHYECGVWMCGTPAVGAVKNDLLRMFEVSEEIAYERWKNRPWRWKLREMILRVFAPVI
jgi:cardiolipin synthase